MSMNLNAKINGETVDLWQTPTNITHMCMVQPDGTISWELTGKKAKHAIHIYLQWTRNHMNGGWNSMEEIESARLTVKNHEEYILDMLKSAKKIEVWMM